MTINAGINGVWKFDVRKALDCVAPGGSLGNKFFNREGLGESRIGPGIGVQGPPNFG